MLGAGQHHFAMRWPGLALSASLALACAALVSSQFLKSSDNGLNGLPVLLPPSLLQTISEPLRAVYDWFASFATEASMPQAERLALLYEENVWKNSLVLSILPQAWVAVLPHFVQTWLRNYLACVGVYLGIGGLWCYYCYYCFGDVLFKPGQIPQASDMLEQIKVSMMSIPLYSLLPAFTEYLAEQGWTRAYPRVANVGLPAQILYFAIYMCCVEFHVYWMHRLLHDIKLGYKWLHFEHHKYNKEHTLSPFAGLAFHPLDGMLQAVPYTTTLLFCPMHFLTHEILLFATGIWTTNIHDCLHGKTWPIMGAGYHAIHHTTYKHNYGHYTVFVDMLFGTMITPEEYAAQLKAE